MLRPTAQPLELTIRITASAPFLSCISFLCYKNEILSASHFYLIYSLIANKMAGSLIATPLTSRKTKTPNRAKHVLEQSPKKNKLSKLLPNCNWGVVLCAELKKKKCKCFLTNGIFNALRVWGLVDFSLKSYWVFSLFKTVPQAIHESSLQIVHKQFKGCVNKLAAKTC